MEKTIQSAAGDGSACGCFEGKQTRRDFLVDTSCVLVAALTASGVTLAAGLPVTTVMPAVSQGTEHTYPLPGVDGVNIDQDNEVILVRQGGRVYAFSLSCPHENTALRWRAADLRFQCPRHESKYQPDGTFVTGRATRNMDRFAIRRAGDKVIVDLAKLFRSDQQKDQWNAAVITL